MKIKNYIYYYNINNVIKYLSCNYEENEIITICENVERPIPISHICPRMPLLYHKQIYKYQLCSLLTKLTEHYFRRKWRKLTHFFFQHANDLWKDYCPLLLFSLLIDTFIFIH